MRLFRQAVTVYEQLKLEQFGGCGEAIAALPGDDIGTRFKDHTGLARRVRERCRTQSNIVGRLMHRETMYQGWLVSNAI